MKSFVNQLNYFKKHKWTENLHLKKCASQCSSVYETVAVGSIPGRFVTKTSKLDMTAILLDAQQKRTAWVPSQQLYLYLAGILSSSMKDKQQEVAWLENRKITSLSPGQKDLQNTSF